MIINVNTFCKTLAVLTAALLTGLATPAQTLVHRYSFTADASDSVGTANGTLVGSPNFVNGAVILNGTNQYVSLPASLITGLTAVTIETWATFSTITNNSFLFGFGNTDASGNGEDYIFCTPHGGGGTRAAISGVDPGYNGEQQAATSTYLDNQTNVMITTVFNPPASFVGLYLNGVLVASNSAVTTALSAVNDAHSYIGHSLYTADPYLKGSISEFRIFNGAVSGSQIALDAGGGPDTLVTTPGNLLSVVIGTTNIFAGTTTQPLIIGNFANVTNVNLFAYGQGNPTVGSLNTNIISVNAAGALTGVAPGSATITANWGGHYAISKTVTVTFPTNQFIWDTFGDGFWTIVNQGNGGNLVVNPTGGSEAVATNTTFDQQFELLYNYQNSTFRIRNHGNWLCVGTRNNGTAIGTGVQTVTYTGLAAQQWYLVPAGTGYYRIVNKASDYALQTDNGNPANLSLAYPSTNSAQLWSFTLQNHFPKKGSAGYEGDYAQLQLSWAYNYDDNTGTTLPPAVNFAPMIYDAPYWEPLGDAQSRDSGWINSAEPDYLLTFNEPDNASQSDYNTNAVIAMWPQIEALNMPIVGPAPQNTGDAWEYNYFTLMANNNYRVDYAAAHEYVPPNASSLISDLQYVYNTWGRPVWLTEFSPVDWSNTKAWSEDTDYNFLAEFMWQAEGLNWLKRYAIFPFSGTNSNYPWVNNGYTGTFFTSGDTLSPYGELYATWDADLTLHARTPYLIHNLGTSFRLTDTNNVSTPKASSIYIRNATTEWALLPGTVSGHWYIVSLNDGRRLRNNAGTLDLAPYGTTNSAVDWWFNGPDANGYYYVDNLARSQSVTASGTPTSHYAGVTVSVVNDPAPSTATQWRLVKPYQPITIVTALPPAVVIGYTSQQAALSWSGNGLYYNVYRSLTSGGPYTKILNLTSKSNYTDFAVANGQAYYYVVTSLNIMADESAYSAEVAALPAATNSVPVTYGLDATGTNLVFNWPSDHTGWRLLMQTNNQANGLSPNPGDWGTVPGSAITNQMVAPLNPTEPAEFYQLVYP